MEEMGTVFISYSHDSVEHLERVLQLSNKLRHDGVDCVLDQYEESPPEGWPRWMDKQIRKAEFVLMVCTANYYKRVMGEEEIDKGQGVKWEGHLIYQHIYNCDSLNNKFIPILFSDCSSSNIPTPLQGASRYDVENQNEYEDLLLRLYKEPKVKKPPLGERRPLPEREAKPDIAMYVAAPIDIDTWDKAKWKGTFFMIAPSGPPVLGLGFEDKDAARKIFIDWRNRFGEEDINEELRVSIIEGAVKNRPAGYTVHIGPNVDFLAQKYSEYGFDKKKDLLACVSRLNRMDFGDGGNALRIFKATFEEYGTYILVPGTVNERKVDPYFDFAIIKKQIYFRNISEITKNDLDSVVLDYHSNLT